MSETIQTVTQTTPHLLIVDDEPAICQMLSLCFQKSYYRISSARDAAEASALLVLERIDAIISDVMMPGEDGIGGTAPFPAATKVWGWDLPLPVRMPCC